MTSTFCIRPTKGRATCSFVFTLSGGPPISKRQSVLKTPDVAAVIVTATNGGPIRTITGRALLRPNGRFPSRKAWRVLPFEAMHERALMWICEADPSIKTFLSQPHRLEMNIGEARPLVYFPDLMWESADGRIEIIETKKTLSEVRRDPRYEMKLELARWVYEREGWSYRVLDEKTIFAEPRWSNARAIVTDRHTVLSSRDKLRLIERLQQGPITYGKAIATLSVSDSPFDPVARAKLHAMFVRRQAHIDISQVIRISTAITATHGCRSKGPSEPWTPR